MAPQHAFATGESRTLEVSAHDTRGNPLGGLGLDLVVESSFGPPPAIFEIANGRYRFNVRAPPVVGKLEIGVATRSQLVRALSTETPVVPTPPIEMDFDVVPPRLRIGERARVRVCSGAVPTFWVGSTLTRGRENSAQESTPVDQSG